MVLRDPTDDVRGLPLTALLSKVPAAFTIDYEHERMGWLATTSQFLQFVKEEGTTLERAAPSGVTGNGKTRLERHLVVVVEPGKPRDMDRRVYLTPKGKRARDSFPYLVVEIEQNWRARYGADCLLALRTTLETLDEVFDTELPDYPNTNAWFYRWYWGDGAG